MSETKNRVDDWGLFLLKLAGLVFVLSVVGAVAYWGFSTADLVLGMALALAIPLVGWFLFTMLLGAVVFGELMERSHARGAETIAEISASTVSAASQMMDAVGRVMEAGMRAQREMWTMAPLPEDGAKLPSPEEAQQFLPSPGGVVDTRQVGEGAYEPAPLYQEEESSRKEVTR
jgi:hypothetical protein